MSLNLTTSKLLLLATERHERFRTQFEHALRACLSVVCHARAYACRQGATRTLAACLYWEASLAMGPSHLAASMRCWTSTSSCQRCADPQKVQPAAMLAVPAHTAWPGLQARSLQSLPSLCSIIHLCGGANAQLAIWQTIHCQGGLSCPCKHHASKQLCDDWAEDSICD